jgi:hypothetical protein
MVATALRDFASATKRNGLECDPREILVDINAAPHRPKGLPTGKMAVYCFFLNGHALKIGVAGPKSDAYGATRANSRLCGVSFEAPGQSRNHADPGRRNWRLD